MAALLTDIFPDPDLLLQLAPEDLAPVVLVLARDVLRNGKVHPQQIFEQVNGPPGDRNKGYPANKKQAAENALNRAWNWLQRNGLLIPEAGMDGANGWHQISPQGAKIAAGGDFESFKQAAAFPKALLHPSIANPVWLELARGEYDTAVLKALRTVEESVREAGGPWPTDAGSEAVGEAITTDIVNLPEPQA